MYNHKFNLAVIYPTSSLLIISNLLVIVKNSLLAFLSNHQFYDPRNKSGVSGGKKNLRYYFIQ